MKEFALGEGEREREREVKGGGEGQGSSPGAVAAWRDVQLRKTGWE